MTPYWKLWQARNRSSYLRKRREWKADRKLFILLAKASGDPTKYKQP